MISYAKDTANVSKTYEIRHQFHPSSFLIAIRSSSPHRHAAIMITEPSTYVTLISSDGFEFIVRRDCAYHSKTIKTMLDPTSKSQILCSRNERQRRKGGTKGSLICLV